MKSMIAVLCTCALTLAALVGLNRLAYAHGADSVAAARAPGHPMLALAAADPAPDPIDNPTGAIQTVQTAWASGRYALAVVLALWVLARLGYSAATRSPTNFFVRKLRLADPRVRAGLVAALGMAAAAAASLAASGRIDWRTLAGALAAAAALYLNPTPAAAKDGASA